MRRLLLSVALALAVGGSVLGAAATLGLDSSVLSAGDAVVAACDHDGNVDVEWAPKWDGPYGFFDAYAVKFSNLDDDCFGGVVDVVLTNAGGETIAHANPGIEWFTLADPDSAYFWAYFSHVNASQVYGLHLLIT